MSGRRPEVTDTILETTGLTREFGGFVAVDGVDLRVRTGTIHALIGPNGAGKTTCFNLLTTFLPPTRGTIRFKGRDITGMKPAMVARLGLVRSFQISAVFPHLTALENVRAGAAARPRRQLRLLALRSGAAASTTTARANCWTMSACPATPDTVVGQAALRPQARAGDRHHAGARTRDDAAGRADRRHGARRRGPHRRR